MYFSKIASASIDAKAITIILNLIKSDFLHGLADGAFGNAGGTFGGTYNLFCFMETQFPIKRKKSPRKSEGIFDLSLFGFGNNLFPDRSQTGCMNRSAFAGAVDAEDSANELNDLIEELIQRVIAVAGAFAIFF